MIAGNHESNSLANMPPELMGKTLRELKAMGAKELATIDIRKSVKWHGMQ